MLQLYIEHWRKPPPDFISHRAETWVKVLTGLTNLSELALVGDVSISRVWALSPISRMQHLQRFSLGTDCYGREVLGRSCDVFALLPASLTALQLQSKHAQEATAAPQLCSLLQLDLERVTVWASLLHSFLKLQRLV